MKRPAILFAALAFTFGAASAQVAESDQSANALCWDTLQNVARGKQASDGKPGATGEMRGQAQTMASPSGTAPREPRSSRRIEIGSPAA